MHLYEINSNITTMTVKKENASAFRIRRRRFGKGTLFQPAYINVIGRLAILGSSIYPFRGFVIRKLGRLMRFALKYYQVG